MNIQSHFAVRNLNTTNFKGLVAADRSTFYNTDEIAKIAESPSGDIFFYTKENMNKGGTGIKTDYTDLNTAISAYSRAAASKSIVVSLCCHELCENEKPNEVNVRIRKNITC